MFDGLRKKWLCGKPVSSANRRRLEVECLEGRLTPASLTWTGNASTDFTDHRNWAPDPGAGWSPSSTDDLTFDGSSVKDCALTSLNVTSDSLTVASGYTGNITMTATTWNVNSDADLGGGTIKLLTSGGTPSALELRGVRPGLPRRSPATGPRPTLTRWSSSGVPLSPAQPRWSPRLTS
jgi:hypothetical protein